ncbi:hypothetical protein GH714_016757 [Hevea brasiliensis]|uniref:Uncharacterized protein n=1 Tax=Hevea brasiliensis TaxID=3981 RepID=A0A6A6LS48_HEVBR|nr:hypothetical protein GH714_016757 [Hevea brasiliensis]
MPSARIRIPIYQQNFAGDGYELQFHDQLAANFSDMIFGFLEDSHEESLQGGTSSEECRENEALDAEDEERSENGSVEEDKNFWEKQHQLLQASLCRTSSLESGIRNVTKEAIKEIQMAGTICGCGRSMVGEHTFLDVIDNSNSKKGEVRVIIELNFQAEFEMAKANEEYNRLVRRLPELFVGKSERLNTVIKILCSAAKKCMKEKKMHLGPWRKQRYMQAKWLGNCERTTVKPAFSTGRSGRVSKPKASMLTVDLLEMLPNMHCTAVEVV